MLTKKSWPAMVVSKPPSCSAIPASPLYGSRSDAEKSAYILADNRLAEKAGWDRSLLVLELQGLIDIGVDV